MKNVPLSVGASPNRPCREYPEGGRGGFLSSLPGLYHQGPCLLLVFGKKSNEEAGENGCDYKVKSRYKENGLRNTNSVI